MAHLALTLKGLSSAVAASERSSTAIWVSAGVIGEDEIRRLRDRGFDVTVFSFPIHTEDRQRMCDVVATIREHHPDDVVWVEQT